VLVLAVFGILVLLAACGTGEQREAGDLETVVYEVTIEAELSQPPSPEPSLNTVRFVAWVAPGRGWWRTEHEDATGFESTEVYTDRGLMKDHNDGPAEVRIGSADFVGVPSTKSFVVDPLRANHPLSVGDEVPSGWPAADRYSLVVRDRIDLGEAVRRGLFAIPTKGANLHRELEPGERSELVRAYWFGPAIEGREAVRAVEMHRIDDAVDLLQTWYELPAARGTTSASPGQTAPPGEITVTNIPIGLPDSRRAIAAFSGRNAEFRYPAWPRMTVRLANGERATVIPDRSEDTGAIRTRFSVLTQQTFVSVIGRFRVRDMPRLAVKLRPIGE
jgi:hypothetical protein